MKDLNAQVNKLNDILNECFIKSCPPTFIRNPKKHKWWTKSLAEAETKLIIARNNHENDPNDLGLQTAYNEAHKAPSSQRNRLKIGKHSALDLKNK